MVANSTATDRLFSSNWQLLEEKVGSNTKTRNVWSAVYIDSMVSRDRDTDANGSLDERLYALQDANFNVTAITNTSGSVQEKYTETPFGVTTFRNSSGAAIGSSAKDWVFLHQGGQADIIGDLDFRNRVLSPTLGRWLSNDPLGFDAGDVNTYRYVENAPSDGLDPTGLDRTIYFFGHTWIVVDVYNEKGEKVGTNVLNFDTEGYYAMNDSFYPEIFGWTIKTTPGEDKALGELWGLMEQGRLKGDVDNWNFIFNNCVDVSVGLFTWGIEPKTYPKEKIPSGDSLPLDDPSIHDLPKTRPSGPGSPNPAPKNPIDKNGGLPKDPIGARPVRGNPKMPKEYQGADDPERHKKGPR